MKNKKGFTLFEIVLVLLIISLIIGTMFIIFYGKIETAEISGARADMDKIHQGLAGFYDDLGFFPKYKDGAIAPSGPKFKVLCSEAGAAPAAADARWLSTDQGYIEDHLVKNNPGMNPYPESARKKDRHWYGPYINPAFTGDPWGNKWYINVEFFDQSGTLPSQKKAVWLLSAGPNKTIETPYEQLQVAARLEGDDIGIQLVDPN